jgi:hypothetical protein
MKFIFVGSLIKSGNIEGEPGLLIEPNTERPGEGMLKVLGLSRSDAAHIQAAMLDRAVRVTVELVHEHT